MTCELSKRERKALTNLNDECNYDKENFIVVGKIGVGIGTKTLGNLEYLELITVGKCSWSGSVGYRITDKGREALKQSEPPKPPRRKNNLKPLKSRLREAPSR